MTESPFAFFAFCAQLDAARLRDFGSLLFDLGALTRKADV